MNNSIDRQGFLDNLTTIETTAKLLLNAFVKKNNDTELITQTTAFLEQAQKRILNISNTCNIPIDGFFQSKDIIYIKEDRSFLLLL
jgi:hypothetical protein